MRAFFSVGDEIAEYFSQKMEKWHDGFLMGSVPSRPNLVSIGLNGDQEP
jgi:hypothetical protein